MNTDTTEIKDLQLTIEKLHDHLYESVKQNLKLLSILELSNSTNSVISLAQSLSLICYQIQDSIHNHEFALLVCKGKESEIFTVEHDKILTRPCNELPMANSLKNRKLEKKYHGIESDSLDFFLPELDFYFNKKVDSHNVIVFPLFIDADESVFGFFVVHTSQGSLKPSEVRFIEACQKQVSHILHIHYLYEISHVDSLTGLFNRRYFEAKLDYEMKRAVRAKSLLSILLLDLDNFKKINDTYGHGQGDKVLTKLGVILFQSIREIDIPCRMGGEEFIIALPQTDIEGSLLVANRIKDSLENEKFYHGDVEFNITASIGIAAFDYKENPTMIDLIAMADKALYTSKQQGKNCITIANEY